MTNSHCEAFLDDLSAVIDGDQKTLELHLDHLSECDHCRDARHGAERIAGELRDAGADFVPPADLNERVLAALGDEEPTLAETNSEREQEEEPATPARTAVPSDAPTAPGPGWQWQSRHWLGAAAAVAAAAAAAVLLVGDRQSATDDDAPAGTSATLAQADHGGKGDATGVSVRAPGAEEFRPASLDQAIVPGSTVRTDEHSLAVLILDDGSRVTFNHLTEVTLDGNRSRSVTLHRGELVADVVHLETGPRAQFATPKGTVEVLGTHFQLVAADGFTSTRVSRGLVRLSGNGSDVEVRPGEEGIVEGDLPPEVAPAVDLGRALAWSELPGPNPEAATPDPGGIGELRAYKPGESRDRDWPLSLKNHKITVRIVGNVARTEIEETFENDSKTTLEGVYRFPLPPDAKIDRLALDVEGKFEEGAFVEKNRASKIWKGVIHNATARRRPRPKDEIIWVPGPWKDPALLEWERGGRFELRIFPIPKKGSRTIKLAYTQTLKPEGKKRRYTYPLPRSADGSTSVGKFDVDVRIAGSDPDATPRVFGYPLEERRDAGARQLTWSQEGFVPRGNLIVEYQLPSSDAELRSWTFRGDVAVGPGKVKKTRKNGVDPKVVDAQRAVAADVRPTALLALRPKLPRWRQARRRDYAIVVDTSQSMVGERHRRSTRLVEALIAEMDRNDRFYLLACDIDCESMTDAATRPTSRSSQQARAWLGEREPAGASNLSMALREATKLAKANAGDRDPWVLYVGDGMASVGWRRPAALAEEASTISADSGVQISTVGIGSDADSFALGAIARAGGGHYVPYVPGKRAAASALAVLETTYGVSLENVEVELPAGMADIAPTVLPTLRAGQELLVSARFTGDVEGDVVLRGTVGGEKYENRFPVKLTASTARGNAFVPRMWASHMIERLELEGQIADEPRIVALSKAYGVLSRQTSLLVLESQAMFDAFGVDRTQPTVRWTGDESDVEVGESSGVVDYGSGKGFGRGGLGGLADLESAPAKDRAEMERPSAPRRRPATKKVKMKCDPSDPLCGLDGGSRSSRRDRRRPSRPRRPREWIAMKKVWYRVAAVRQYDGVSDRVRQAAVDAQRALTDNPNSREEHRKLVEALSYAGELERAVEVARDWQQRDRMDPEALLYIADMLGRAGERKRALRILSGAVDIQLDDTDLQTRLADAYERIGAAEHACSHRLALAELDPSSPKTVAAAVRCHRALGREDVASRLFAAAPEEKRTAVEKAAIGAPVPEQPRGNLIVDATWRHGADLDISVITPKGRRISWMGGDRGLAVIGASDLGQERLGVRRLRKGEYLIEVSRADGGTGPVSGEVAIQVLGKRQRIPFSLSGERTVVGAIKVSWRSKMVEVRREVRR